MLKNRVYFLFLFVLCACQSRDKDAGFGTQPRPVAQWLNPLFFNEDFDNELSFPLWFDDSLIRAQGIEKITRRTYPRILGDSSDVNTQREAMPREKREYYFDPNGFVDRLVIYSYFDDREIARASFAYRGNMDPNGFRRVIPLKFRYLSEKGNTSDFSTDSEAEREYNFILHHYLKRTPKYTAYADNETGEQLLFLKDQKYWGPLSVDSILHPQAQDWVIWGSLKKPYKRYKVENKVTETEVHRYKYWKTGVLKQRILESYPFENRRCYRYDPQYRWCSYTDSTFSEGQFITMIESRITYDPSGRPAEISHQKGKNKESGFYYVETLRYQLRANPSISK
jgi:hypothetical protein